MSVIDSEMYTVMVLLYDSYMILTMVYHDDILSVVQPGAI